jgi:hypothetical protein
MAISFLGQDIARANNGGDPSIDLTTIVGLAENDLVVVAYGIGDNDGVDETMAMITTGYTKIADLFADDDQDTNLGVFWKFMGATVDTTAVCDGLGGNDAAVSAIALAFRGVDTSTPIDVTTTTATGVNSNIPDPPSIDYPSTGVWTLAAGAFGHTSGPTVTMTVPTNYAGISYSANDTSDVCTALAYYDSPADPEDPGAFGPSIADNVAHSWCAATVALRPAPAGAAAGAYYQQYYKSVVTGVL